MIYYPRKQNILYKKYYPNWDNIFEKLAITFLLTFIFGILIFAIVAGINAAQNTTTPIILYCSGYCSGYLFVNIMIILIIFAKMGYSRLKYWYLARKNDKNYDKIIEEINLNHSRKESLEFVEMTKGKLNV